MRKVIIALGHGDSLGVVVLFFILNVLVDIGIHFRVVLGRLQEQNCNATFMMVLLGYTFCIRSFIKGKS